MIQCHWSSLDEQLVTSISYWFIQKKMYFWIFFCTTNIASCMLTKAENNYLNSSESGKGYSSVQNKFSKWEGWGMRKSRVAFTWNRGELLSRTHTDVICCVPYVRSLEWDLIAGRISSYCFILIYINLLKKKKKENCINLSILTNCVHLHSDCLKSELFLCNTVLSL